MILNTLSFTYIEVDQAAQENPKAAPYHPSPSWMDINGDKEQTEQSDIFQNDVRDVGDEFVSELDLEDVIQKKFNQHVEEDQGKADDDPLLTAYDDVVNKYKRQRKSKQQPGDSQSPDKLRAFPFLSYKQACDQEIEQHGGKNKNIIKYAHRFHVSSSKK